MITAYTSSGEAVKKEIELTQSYPKSWPLSYAVDFSEVERLSEVVQIVDGLWALGEDGVRTVVTYYDRVLAMGETSWNYFEATIRLTVHGFTPSEPGPPAYDVTHFGVALRWRGHHQDNLQPHRKWYPLGAQGEFLLKENSASCAWRILFDARKDKPNKWSEQRNTLILGKPIMIRAQVMTLPDGQSRYRFKQWSKKEAEPTVGDIEDFETDDYPSGALCLVPHNSDVTIHRVKVDPLPAE